jgi:four helix bundle protein
LRNFRDLHIWARAKDFAAHIYKISNAFPEEEKFGLISQIRRSAVSIPANIAEGAGRNTKKDFTQFLHIAVGSAFELETLLEISHDVGMLDNENYEQTIIELHEIQAMINAYLIKIKS